MNAIAETISDQQQFNADLMVELERYAGQWICPYCGNECSEEAARFSGCCGEVHCLEPNSEEWIEFIAEGLK